MAEIDYSPLSQDPKSDIYVDIAILGAILVIGFRFSQGAYIISGDNLGWFFLFIILAAIIAVNFSVRSLYVSNKSVNTFAKKNKFNQTLKWYDIPLRSYMRQRLLRSRQINVVSGTFNNVEFQSYDLVSSLAPRKYRVVAALELKLDKDFPQVFISAKKNDRDFPDGMNENYNKAQDVDVGGTFNQNFSVYVPKEYEIEGLDIVDPSLIDVIDRYGQRIDAEFIGDRVLFYLPTKTIRHTQQRYRELFIFAQEVADYISHKQKAWRFIEIPHTPTTLRENYEISEKTSTFIATAVAYTINIIIISIILLIVGGFIIAANDITNTFN